MSRYSLTGLWNRATFFRRKSPWSTIFQRQLTSWFGGVKGRDLGTGMRGEIRLGWLCRDEGRTFEVSSGRFFQPLCWLAQYQTTLSTAQWSASNPHHACRLTSQPIGRIPLEGYSISRKDTRPGSSSFAN